MKPVKKNNFFTFIFSFLPGAAEMYLGFMKNGFSILAVFALLCGAITTMRIDFLLFVLMLIYCFGFFHARNVAKLDDEGFARFPDVYVWEEFDTKKAFTISSSKLRTVAAAALILIGAGILWSYVTDIIYKYIPREIWDDLYPVINNLPSVAIAIALIAAGVILVRGKKKELTITQNAADVVATDVFVAKDNSKEA